MREHEVFTTKGRVALNFVLGCRFGGQTKGFSGVFYKAFCIVDWVTPLGLIKWVDYRDNALGNYWLLLSHI